MTSSSTRGNRVDDAAATGPHPYDYYWRPGMPLRTAPPRVRFDAIWSPPRRLQLAPWRDFKDVPVATAWTDLYTDHLWQGDELMDNVVNRFRRMGAGEGRTILEQALDHGIGSVDIPPRELTDLFEQLDNSPAWFDPDMWERGRQLWNNASLASKIGMAIGDGFGTLVGDEVSNATGRTGRLVNDPLRRYLETLTWFHNMTYRGAMSRTSDPFKDTVRVRLMHAQVRAGLRRSCGDDHFAHHGNPISNATMMAAALTFGLQPLLIDHAHGRTCTTSDLDAVLMYWGYIAYIFGVADELIPQNCAQALEAMDFTLAHAGGPSEWTDTMITTMIDGERAGPLTRAAMTPVLGLMAYYGGTDMTKALIRATSLTTVTFAPWIRVASVFVNLNVRFRRLLDRTPRAAQRARARESDSAMFGAWLKVVRFAAARGGIHETRYDHHNQTASIGAGCPIPPPSVSP
ncbi:DUF2236 domain-containing protein [Mycobacterium sp. CBMA271]|uniref:oxygenase MpaB family protein n=1 Tax=unclassified Mycobacteroides TaxID=2618759 RepID=UPI0012DE6D1F|nr:MULTISPECIES: oxygenase MpaB family protein [unclassified Mycobacteroides]MUM18523.1 hypothetical protein [Mycobacteroides sp. CBMA 326]MUM23792.1 DUF2236 domain-containing protein [Mycobacteroides sp. CBMA 271]